jgi:hypothetical protein
LLYQLQTLPTKFLAREILSRLSVRIHSAVVGMGRAWAKLWYLLRGLDIQGSGFAKIPLSQVCTLLNAKPSTVRQWLREGQKAKAFRRWRERRGILKIAMGSLFKVLQHLGLTAPGASGYEPLHKLFQLRALATGLTTQRLQQLSRFAAWRRLPGRYRKTYRLPQPDAFFEPRDFLSDKNATRELKCVMHIGKFRIFTSKGFVPYGVTQKTIASERGYKSDRTIRRHLNALGVQKRQIVQSKGAYKSIMDALAWDSPGIAPEPTISMTRVGQLTLLTEPSGRVGMPHSTPVSSDRFFEYGARFYIYRCNLYKPTFRLSTMKRFIVNNNRLLAKSASRTK